MNKPKHHSRKGRKAAAATEPPPEHKPKEKPVTDESRYSELVEKIGGHLIAASHLGVHPETIIRRCNGSTPLSREAFLALERISSQTPGLVP